MAKIKSNKIKDCPPENVFWLCTGVTLKNIEELKKALKTMEDGVFNYHVNAEKNDFANWIKDIFKDIKLAERLQKVKSKEDYVKIIEGDTKKPEPKRKQKRKGQKKT